LQLPGHGSGEESSCDIDQFGCVVRWLEEQKLLDERDAKELVNFRAEAGAVRARPSGP
jgi:hypothetical protein